MQKFLVDNWWVLAVILLVMVTVMVVILVIANYREKKLFLEVEDQILSDQSQEEQERLQNLSKQNNVANRSATAKTDLATKETTKSAKPTTKAVAKKPVTQTKASKPAVNKKTTTKNAVRSVKPATSSKPTKKD